MTQFKDRYRLAAMRLLHNLGEHNWSGQSFQSRLRVVLLAICFCAMSLAGVAYWKSWQSEYLLERSRLAHQVLGSYLGLMVTVQNLHHLVDHQASTDALVSDADRIAQRKIIDEMMAKVGSLRAHIVAEIELVGSAHDENEKEELERLALIERHLSAFLLEFDKLFSTPAGRAEATHKRIQRALDEHAGKVVQDLIADGIADEQGEVRRTDQLAGLLIKRSRKLTMLISAAALLVTFAGWIVLVKSVREPLGELQLAMRAFASGDMSRRVSVSIGHDEFAQLGEFFNKMAGEIESRGIAASATLTTLERSVEERTRSLAALNAQLEASDQSRRRFLADLSHELRTPLTIIRGESEIALRTADAKMEEYRSAITRILEQAKHTGTLVDDLLFIARREVGEARINLNALDLRPLLQQVCAELTPACRELDLTVSCDVGNDGATVALADASRIKQVLLVLIDNAMRYSRPGGTIDARLMPAPSGIAIIVRDDGIGILADDLPHVFDRFYRGSNASAKTHDGVGLGLPIAKAIVDAHGGTIAIESELDQGTTVTVTLAPAVRPGQPRLKAVS